MGLTRLLHLALFGASVVLADDNADAVRSQIEANRNNLTALQMITAPPWVDAPEFRGTTTILWSCLITLFACVYTALHLNIPSNTSTRQTLKKKISWVLLTVVAPEITLHSAFSQYLEARRFLAKLKKLQRESDSADKKFEFTMKYAFFIQMGGLKTPVRGIVSDDYDRWEFAPIDEFDFGSLDNATLTTNGVLVFAQLGHFIYIPSSKIEDKSKSDLVQKCLVILQVSWMLLQCITRRAYGLPLTLLEIHTMVHVLCALTLYSFWIKKPLDVREPELLLSPVERDITALFVQFHLYGLPTRIASGVTRTTDEDNDPASIEWVEPQDETITLQPGQVLSGGIGLGFGAGNPRILSRQAIERYRRIRAAIDAADKFEVKQPTLLRDLRLGELNLPSAVENSLKFKSSNLPMPPNAHYSFDNYYDYWFEWFAFTNGSDYSDLVADPSTYVFLVMLPLLYGGIHLTAWNIEFPSLVESVMWRTACFVIICGVPLLVGLAYVLFQTTRKTRYHGCLRVLVELLDVIWFLMLFISGIILIATYVVSRLFIIVEAFIGLRRVPIGVYWTPAWLQMIPHV